MASQSDGYHGDENQPMTGPVAWNLVTPHELANIMRDGGEKILLVDSRSFLEYNTSHIQQAINVCGSKLVKRRLQQGKVRVKDLLTQTCQIDVDESWDIIVYDQCTEDPSYFTNDNFVYILLSKLTQVFTCVTFLKGGLLGLQAMYPSLIENKDIMGYKCTALTSLSQPCMPVSNMGPTRILPFLYLGSQRDALSKDVAQINGITYILNVSLTCPKPPYIQDAHFKRIPINDNYCERMVPFFKEAFQFLDMVRESNGCVLVHCLAGVSRSPTLAIAYVMRHLKMMSEDAYRYVKDKRPTISPNFNFLGQLLDYERKLLQGDIEEALEREAKACKRNSWPSPFVMDLQTSSPSSPQARAINRTLFTYTDKPSPVEPLACEDVVMTDRESDDNEQKSRCERDLKCDRVITESVTMDEEMCDVELRKPIPVSRNPNTLKITSCSNETVGTSKSLTLTTKTLSLGLKPVSTMSLASPDSPPHRSSRMKRPISLEGLSTLFSNRSHPMMRSGLQRKSNLKTYSGSGQSSIRRPLSLNGLSSCHRLQSTYSSFPLSRPVTFGGLSTKPDSLNSPSISNSGFPGGHERTMSMSLSQTSFSSETRSRLRATSISNIDRSLPRQLSGSFCEESPSDFSSPSDFATSPNGFPVGASTIRDNVAGSSDKYNSGRPSQDVSTESQSALTGFPGGPSTVSNNDVQKQNNSGFPSGSGSVSNSEFPNHHSTVINIGFPKEGGKGFIYEKDNSGFPSGNPHFVTDSSGFPNKDNSGYPSVIPHSISEPRISTGFVPSGFPCGQRGILDNGFPNSRISSGFSSGPERLFHTRKDNISNFDLSEKSTSKTFHPSSTMFESGQSMSNVHENVCNSNYVREQTAPFSEFCDNFPVNVSNYISKVNRMNNLRTVPEHSHNSTLSMQSAYETSHTCGSKPSVSLHQNNDFEETSFMSNSMLSSIRNRQKLFSQSCTNISSLQSPTTEFSLLTVMEDADSVVVQNESMVHNFPATSLDKLNFTPCLAREYVSGPRNGTKRNISATECETKTDNHSPMSVSSNSSESSCTSSLSSNSPTSVIPKVILRKDKVKMLAQSDSDTKSSELSSPVSIESNCSSPSNSSLASPTTINTSKVILRSRENKSKRTLGRPNSIAFSTYPSCDLGSDCQDSPGSVSSASQDDSSEAYMLRSNKKSKPSELSPDKKSLFGQYSEREFYKQISAAMESAKLSFQAFDHSRKVRSMDDILSSDSETKIPRRLQQSLFDGFQSRCRGSSDPYQSSSSISSGGSQTSIHSLHGSHNSLHGSQTSLHGSMEIIQVS